MPIDHWWRVDPSPTRAAADLPRPFRSRSAWLWDARGRGATLRARMLCRTVSILAAALLAAAAERARADPAPSAADVPPQAEPGVASPGAEPSAVPATGATRARMAGTPPGPPSWFALPVLFWLPETRLGYGGTGGIHFHVGGADRASSVFAVAVYTLEDQFSTDLAADVTLPSGVNLGGRTKAVNFPDSFYGLGPESSVADRERYTRRWLEGTVAAEVPVWGPKLRAGLRVDGRAEQVRDVEAGGMLASGTIPGSNGYNALGFGGSVTWDTRDRPLYPNRGSYAQIWYLQYPGALTNGAPFARGNMEGRVFLPLGEGRVLGAAAFLEHAFGTTPFQLLPKLGSNRYLRGWLDGRFRDQVAWSAQAELRVPLWMDRLHGVAFGAFGDVGPKISALRADTLKTAAGVGARWRLTPEGANIRVDVAGSDAGVELYVLVLEAF